MNCTGSRLDGLWFDDEANGFHGCGQNASNGEGLWSTSNGGQTWSQAQTEADTWFSNMRVNHIYRDPTTDLLYVSGIREGGNRVVGMARNGTLSEVWNNGTTVDYSFTAGSYARNSSGVQVAESLTGSGIVVQTTASGWDATYSDTDSWGSAYGWWNHASDESGLDWSTGAQVLDMVVVDDHIIGSGSTINQPPAIYLPPRTWDFAKDGDGDEDAYVEQMWEIVPLTTDFQDYKGECWSVDGNEDGLVIGCTNQDDDAGMVYTIGSDWKTTGYDSDNWTSTNTSSIIGGDSNWTRAVCRGQDNLVAAAGDLTSVEDGWLLVSTDGGANWTDYTDQLVEVTGGAVNGLYRCQFVGRTLFVGGAQKMFRNTF